jgi:hypothetical protein
MTERNNENRLSGAAEARPGSDLETASNTARLIASAIALVSSAALVTWAALHSSL